jgi:alcohol dehydrogenase class IV
LAVLGTVSCTISRKLDDTKEPALKKRFNGSLLAEIRPHVYGMNLPSQTVIFRDGALAELGAVLKRQSARRVLLVADPTAVAASGAESNLDAAFQSREVARFCEFEVNPKSADVERGIRHAREFHPDAVIGFGGGTAIDLAKLISSLAGQAASLEPLISGVASLVGDSIPLVAIPTTAGTGSEATHFAVVYHDGQKYSLAHPSLLPTFALIDPVLSYSMPKSLSASTGLDAMCQAIESIWAVGATDQSVGYATEALRLALKHLDLAVNAPTPESRRGMCEAAHLAGRAINISLTTAPHALSYWLTSQYGVPHGVAVAVFLGRMLEFNALVSASNCNDGRGPAHVRGRIADIVHELGAQSAPAARKKLEELIRKIGCPVTLRAVGVVEESALRRLVAEVNVERLSNNPRGINAFQLFELLREPN